LNCVVVHPGAHKTASSFIQKAIRADANTLERQLGLISRGYRDLTDIPIIQEMKGSQPRCGVPTQAKLDDFQRKLRSFNIDPEQPLLISNEGLFGSLRPDENAHLYPNAGRHTEILYSMFKDRLRVVFYIRHPLDYFISAYVQRVQSGYIVEWSSFKRTFHPERLAWSKPLLDIMNCVGKDNVLVVPYDYIRDDPFGYCNAVLNFFGLRFSSLPQRPENISLSDTALRVALAAYPHLEQKERRSLRKYLQRQLSGPAYEKFYPFTAQEVSSFLTAYAPETERLTKLLQPRFSSYVLRWLDRA